MDNILRTLYQERASYPSTLGVMVIEATDKIESATDTFDAIILIITNEQTKQLFIKHYSYEDKKIALYIVNENQIKEWLMKGTNRKVFDWLFQGRIVFDRNDYMRALIQELKDFPFHERKLRIGLEFAKLVRRYVDGKKLYEQKHYLDAYNHIIHSLHHLGRLSLIEKGYHPEVTVWDQVKNIEPEIYKMYEELINSDEPLNKRLQLLFLASEFFIHSRTELGAAHIIEVLKERDYWSIQDIIEHPEIQMYTVDIFVVLEYLVDKGYLNTVREQSKGRMIEHRYYTTTNETSR